MGLFTSIKPALVERSAFNTVLVVEDDEDTCEMLTLCIESETSCRVLSLSSSEEVLQGLQPIQEAKPRLFIFDYHLVALTGLELYDSLHALKEFEHIPAIIITATTLNLELEHAIAQRKLTLLLKPFDIDELIERIGQMLNGHRQLI